MSSRPIPDAERVLCDARQDTGETLEPGTTASLRAAVTLLHSTDPTVAALASETVTEAGAFECLLSFGTWTR